MMDYNAKSTVKPKYIEDSYSSCLIHGFNIYDNPKIRYIRITTSNSNCENMYDYTFEYNYFIDYDNLDLFKHYLYAKGYYQGNIYDAIAAKYGEYLQKDMISVDLKKHGISFIEDCYYYNPDNDSKYKNFEYIDNMEEFKKLLP